MRGGFDLSASIFTGPGSARSGQ